MRWELIREWSSYGVAGLDVWWPVIAQSGGQQREDPRRRGPTALQAPVRLLAPGELFSVQCLHGGSGSQLRRHQLDAQARPTGTCAFSSPFDIYRSVLLCPLTLNLLEHRATLPIPATSRASHPLYSSTPIHPYAHRLRCWWLVCAAVLFCEHSQKTRLLGTSLSLGLTCLIGAFGVSLYDLPKLEMDRAHQQYELRVSRAAVQRREQQRRERLDAAGSAAAPAPSSSASAAAPAPAAKKVDSVEEFFEVDVLDPEDGE
jgi:hypothetical protein